MLDALCLVLGFLVGWWLRGRSGRESRLVAGLNTPVKDRRKPYQFRTSPPGGRR